MSEPAGWGQTVTAFSARYMARDYNPSLPPSPSSFLFSSPISSVSSLSIPSVLCSARNLSFRSFDSSAIHSFFIPISRTGFFFPFLSDTYCLKSLQNGLYHQAVHCRPAGLDCRRRPGEFLQAVQFHFSQNQGRRRL